MGFIQEAINDFYKKQTFADVATLYTQEFKKLAIRFFRKKGVNKFAYDVDFNNLPKDADDRRSMLSSQKGIDVRRNAMGANVLTTYKDINSYGGKFTDTLEHSIGFRFEYDNITIVTDIISSFDFYKKGHKIIVGFEDRKYKYDMGRVLLTVDLYEALENIWSKILEAVEKYKNKESSTPEKRDAVGDDIKRLQSTVDKYMNTIVKIYKNGKKKLITDKDKRFGEFKVKYRDMDVSDSSVGRKQGFNIEIALLKRMKTSLDNPDLLKAIPNIENIIEIANDLDIGYSAEHLLGSYLLRPEHDALFDRFKFLIVKFAKMGYYPKRKGESFYDLPEVEFYYDVKKANRIANDPEGFFNSPTFRNNIKIAFYSESDGYTISEKLYSIIERVFTKDWSRHW